MDVKLHAHALTRIEERGVTEEEVKETVRYGEPFPAKYGRKGFRRNFKYDARWRGKHFLTKKIEAIAVEEGEDWLVITVMVKFY